jgi:ATP-dependent Clp protease adaptor protein ClpS
MAFEVETIKKIELKEPSLFNVVFINDDFTPMDFVIETLRLVYAKTHADAVLTTLEVHEKGRGVAGIFTMEVAQQKVQDTLTLAARFGHPLKVISEKAG